MVYSGFLFTSCFECKPLRGLGSFAHEIIDVPRGANILCFAYLAGKKIQSLLRCQMLSGQGVNSFPPIRWLKC